MYDFVIHISRGRLGVTNTGQQEYGDDEGWKEGVNPS